MNYVWAFDRVAMETQQGATQTKWLDGWMEMPCVPTAAPEQFITDFGCFIQNEFLGVLWAFVENSLSVFEHPLGSHWGAVVSIIHESTHQCPASSISHRATVTVFASEVAAPNS